MDIEEAKKQLLKHKKEIDEKYISARYSKAIEVVLSELDKKEKENTILRHGLKENTEEIDMLNGIIDLMAEQLTTPVHNKKWVIDYFTNKVEEDIKE